jgi:hypothetical protein
MESKDEHCITQKDTQPSQTCSGGFIKTQLCAICCCFFSVGELGNIIQPYPIPAAWPFPSAFEVSAFCQNATQPSQISLEMADHTFLLSGMGIAVPFVFR